MEPKLDQKPPKSSPDGAQGRQNGAKMAPKWGQDGEKIKEKHQRNKEEGSVSDSPPREPKKWPTWPQLGPQNGAKMAKKSMQKCVIFLMPLGIDFWMDFGGFWVPKSSQVDAKMGSKIDVNSERRVFKK